VLIDVPATLAATPGVGDAIDVVISGAVPMPHYRHGETDLDAWRDEIRTRPVPWAEFESDELVFTVKEVGLLGGITTREATVDEFEERLMALATRLEGCRTSFEYIQDYVNIYGLRVWQEETAAVKKLLELGADPNLGDAEGRSPLSVVNSGNTGKFIKEALEKCIQENAENPGAAKETQEDFERRSAMQAKQAALFAEKMAKAEAEAEANAEKRAKQLEEEARARAAKAFMEDAVKKDVSHRQTVPMPYNISALGEAGLKAELRRQKLLAEKEEREMKACTFRPKTNERPRKELIEKLLAEDEDDRSPVYGSYRPFSGPGRSP
jgi:hypothetical protein